LDSTVTRAGIDDAGVAIHHRLPRLSRAHLSGAVPR
jgi:hypothetical protein